MQPTTIAGINRLPPLEKRQIYSRVVPPEMLERFNLSPYLIDLDGHDLLHLEAHPGSPTVEMALYHRAGFQDPILYGHLTDTISGQLHILLYILNDPDSPRYDTDRLPNGTATKFGTLGRNLDAEIAAMQAGLAPGQIRHGLRMLASAIIAFEGFIQSLGHTLHFAEPLYYHNAALFEHYGFGYQQGRRLMERINQGFSPGGDLLPLLNGSTPFRQPCAAKSIRLRSWAVYDGILGEPFNNVTMYKHVGKHAGISTCPVCEW